MVALCLSVYMYVYKGTLNPLSFSCVELAAHILISIHFPSPSSSSCYFFSIFPAAPTQLVIRIAEELAYPKKK